MAIHFQVLSPETHVGTVLGNVHQTTNNRSHTNTSEGLRWS